MTQWGTIFDPLCFLTHLLNKIGLFLIFALHSAGFSENTGCAYTDCVNSRGWARVRTAKGPQSVPPKGSSRKGETHLLGTRVQLISHIQTNTYHTNRPSIELISLFINKNGTKSGFLSVRSYYLFRLAFHLHQIPIKDGKKFEYLSLLNYIISLYVND